MQNTREFDIAKIEEDMAKGVISQKNGRALIDKMYKQTKDMATEDFRKKLIEAQKERDRKYRMVRENPEQLHPDQFKAVLNGFTKSPNLF